MTAFRTIAACVVALSFLAALPARAEGGSGGATLSTHSTPFGDSDPVEWNGRAPWRYAVHGIDVARFQGEINWRRVRGAGVEFAFIKATEGGNLLDPMFKQNWRGAGKAGVARGAYHFYYFCTPPEVQARWFIRNVPRERGALPHVLDVEWNHKSPTCRLRPPADTVRSEMTIFLDMLERHYGKRPIIYTTVDFHRDNLAGHMDEEVFWLRSVKAHPHVTYPGRDWAFWQYTGTGLVPGVNGDTDINVFAGNRNQWRDWLDVATR